MSGKQTLQTAIVLVTYCLDVYFEKKKDYKTSFLRVKGEILQCIM